MEREISMDNGRTGKTVSELTDEEIAIISDNLDVGNFYEAEIADAVSAELNEDASYREWLAEYINRLPYDIVIG